MKNKTFILITFLLLLFSQSIKAQSNTDSTNKYVIFTFEIKHKGSKINEYYYWMARQDSIPKKKAFEVFPLYTEEYSRDLLNKCKTGSSIDIFAATTATNFNFDDNYKLEVKNLIFLINIKKEKIQSFKKRWVQNDDEVNVNVYATPIIGKFCDCLEIHGSMPYDFKGLVYLPVAAFSYDNTFWNSKDANIVRYVDYSYVEYSSHYPSNMHGNTNIRVKSNIQTFR
ncbi:hypothetical protein COR50_00325 [Chitinophaga caeni]|uniref:GLPGLI family protein n=1 Tax=Chitinophaga caeni TaxID=2029983 RepID=A0A291QP65_9BACT|nr:hypothetical protein [Chitinophaga caeni]ATL45726.1 hypothetical protein COR50_00325 [Chitinophaga caeni]